ncbi:hypothetical protein D9M73_68980 [compost metagenome]
MSQISTSGLSHKQEPKYATNGGGKLFNRATGNVIPDDEPVMIFRAQDRNVVPMLWAYYDTCLNADHRAVIKSRISDFERFAEAHPERMKEPDSNLQELAGANLSATAPTPRCETTSTQGLSAHAAWPFPTISDDVGITAAGQAHQSRPMESGGGGSFGGGGAEASYSDSSGSSSSSSGDSCSSSSSD